MTRKSLTVDCGILFLTAVLCGSALRYMSQPFPVVFAIVAFFCLVSIPFVSGRKKILSLTLSATFFALTISEIFVGRIAYSCLEKNDVNLTSGLPATEGAFWRSDPVLGYRPSPNIAIHSWKKCHGQKVYDVHYTINENGQRQVPRPETIDGAPIAVFGDSFGFGMGVEDDQTMAWFLEKESNWKFHTFNFSYNGYGPHQTYTILKNHLEVPLWKDKQPALGIYFAVFDLNRAGGWSYWDKSGPLYRLDSKCEPVYRGAFSSSRTHRFFFQLERSSLFRELVEPHFAGHREQDLFVQLVSRSSRLFQLRYSAKYLVLLWGEGKRFSSVVEQLRETGVSVITPSEIFPEFDQNPDAYILPNDRHPLPATNEKIARFILQRFLSVSPSASR